MDYMTPKQAGELWGISERRVEVLCAEGRLQGAERLGSRIWMIPKSTSKPIDARTRKARLKKSQDKEKQFYDNYDS